MSISDGLVGAAKDLARELESQHKTLDSQLSKAKREVSELEAKVKATRLATERALNFDPLVGAEYQCPRCWIIGERRSMLRRVGGHGFADTLDCDVCHRQYPVPD